VTAGQVVTVAYAKSGTASQNLASSAGDMSTMPLGTGIFAANAVCYSANCVTGTTVRIQPSNPLVDSGNMRYVVNFPPAVLQDLSGRPHGGLTLFPPDYLFRLLDTSPPLLSATPFSPTSGSSTANKGDNMVISFLENIQAGTGNIIITPSEGNSQYNGAAAPNQAVLIDVQDETQVTFFQLSCTINPASDLVDMLGKKHTVTFASGVIVDGNSLPFAGISAGTPYEFNILDTTDPVLLSVSPVRGTHNVAPDTTISFTFSEDIVANPSGTITLTPSSGAPIVYGATSAHVSVNNAVLTVTPATTLNYDETYTVTFSAGVVNDGYSGGGGANPCAALSSGYEFRITIRLRIIFSQAIQAGTGFFRIFGTNSNVGTVVQIADSTRISISGSTMTLSPIGVPADTEYYLTMGPDVLKDTRASPHGFAGTVFHYLSTSGDHYLQFRYT